jgi:hypothetical protein
MCKGKGVQPQGEAPVSLLQMTHQTIIPPEKLSTWYFAIRWGRFALEQANLDYARNNYNTEYNTEVIKQLLEIEATLQQEWDAYMDSFAHTQPEVQNYA